MTIVGSSILSDLKELKKLVHERCRSWFSELSIMEDEVRNRTILVRVHSERDPISDLTVYEVFSDFGLIEKFRYMCAESGFHYLLQFGSVRSANQSLQYYNGSSNFHGYRRFDVSFVNEVISSYIQKVFDGFRKTIHEESPKNDEDVKQTEESIQEGEPESLIALNQGEEVVQIETNDEPVVAKDSIDLTACQVFDEMPVPFEKGIEPLNAFTNEFKVLADDTLDKEAPPLIFEEQDDLNVYEIVICFDPGGGALSLVQDSFILQDVARELHYCDGELNGMPNLLRNRLSSIEMNQLELPTSEHGEAKVSCGYLMMPTLSCKSMSKVDDVFNQEDDINEVQLLDELAVKNGVVIVADDVGRQHSVFICKIRQEKISFKANLTTLFDKRHLQGDEGYLENLRFEFYNSGILIFDPGGQLLSHGLGVSWFLVDVDKTYLCAHAAFDENNASTTNLQLLLGHYFKENKASLMGLDKHIRNALSESETRSEFSYLGVDCHGARRLTFDPGGESLTFVYRRQVFCGLGDTHHETIWLAVEVKILTKSWSGAQQCAKGNMFGLACVIVVADGAFYLVEQSTIMFVFDPGGQTSKAP